jgi:hypothetical protein
MRATAPSRNKPRLSAKRSMRVRVPVLMLSAMLLAGCATDGTATSKAAICAGVKPLTYSSKHDTPETVRQIRETNLFNMRRGCIKAGPNTR